MTLEAIAIQFDAEVGSTSESEQKLITAAAERIRNFLSRKSGVTTLLTSDPQDFCVGLRSLRRQRILRGLRFCEWGSGIGLLSGLAALNGFDAYGIEIQADFIDEAEALCWDFSLSVNFACGSFVPAEFDERFCVVGTFGATDWRVKKGRDVYNALGMSCTEMDLIYAYPWPREVALYEHLFDLTAREGAILWLYRQGESPRILVKF